MSCPRFFYPRWRIHYICKQPEFKILHGRMCDNTRLSIFLILCRCKLLVVFFGKHESCLFGMLSLENSLLGFSQPLHTLLLPMIWFSLLRAVLSYRQIGDRQIGDRQIFRNESLIINTLHFSKFLTKVAATRHLLPQLWRQREYGWTPLLKRNVRNNYE